MYTKEFSLLEKQVKAIQEDVSKKHINRVLFVSCGGSLATIQPGTFLLDELSDSVFSKAYNSNEFLSAIPRGISEKTLVVLNSQTGNTAETYAAAEKAKELGATLIAFSTNPESKLCALADHPVYYYDNPLDPYPLGLSIYPIVYKTMFALIDTLEGTNYSSDVQAALDSVDEIVAKSYEHHLDRAREFAKRMLNEQVIYTVGGGINTAIAYVVSNCLVMESLWLDSSALAAGEFFHGAVEAFDENSAVFALLGLHATRQMEERVVKFLQRKSNKITTLDANSLFLDSVKPWLKPFFAPIILNFIAAKYIDELSYLKGHPVSSRRYMGVEKY